MVTDREQNHQITKLSRLQVHNSSGLPSRVLFIHRIAEETIQLVNPRVKKSIELQNIRIHLILPTEQTKYSRD